MGEEDVLGSELSHSVARGDRTLIFFRRWICVSIRPFVPELSKGSFVEGFGGGIVMLVVTKREVSL